MKLPLIARWGGLATACGLCAALIPGAAIASGSASNTLTPSASVTQNCTIASSNLVFGPYDPVVANATSNLTGSTTVAVQCTKNASGVTVTADGGKNTGVATSGDRAMLGVAATPDHLNYQLYTNSGLTTVWSLSGGNSLVVPTFTTGLTPFNLNIYGQVFGGQDVQPDTYSDTVNMTVNF